MSASRILLTAGIALTLALIAVSLYLYFEVSGNQDKLTQLLKDREQAYRLADELRQSSDDLTRMVRTYAVTGDEFYYQRFEEIADIRGGLDPRPEDYHLIYWDLVTTDNQRPRPSGGLVALRTLMSEAGFTDTEFGYLQQSEDRSNRLIELEQEAFAAAKIGNLARAQELVHSPEYHQSKKQIMEPLLSFFEAIDQRISTEITDSEARQKSLKRYWLIAIILSMALAALSTATAIFTGQRESRR